MAKTALELTTEELCSYRPGRRRDVLQTSEQWEQAWEVARTAARLLRERFQATRVVAFGSLTHRSWFTPWSDIDLAAWGIPTHEFYRAVAVVTGISPDFEVNLAAPEGCPPAVRQAIEREGIDM